jgi:hypothetical protein
MNFKNSYYVEQSRMGAVLKIVGSFFDGP